MPWREAHFPSSYFDNNFVIKILLDGFWRILKTSFPQHGKEILRPPPTCLTKNPKFWSNRQIMAWPRPMLPAHGNWFWIVSRPALEGRTPAGLKPAVPTIRSGKATIHINIYDQSSAGSDGFWPLGPCQTCSIVANEHCIGMQNGRYLLRFFRRA